MTKPEAREILMNFVRRMRTCGISWADVEENFDLAYGFENEEERLAYDLVGDALPHMLAWVYTQERSLRGSW